MKNSSDQKNPMALFLARAVVIIFNIAVSASILFLAAGQINWLAGWLYMISYLLFNLLSTFLKSKQGSGGSYLTKGATWANILSQLFRLTHPATLILAGMEHRFFQSLSLIPTFVQISGFMLLLFSFGLIGWSRAVNPYYDYEIPKQDLWDQDLTVTGPYEFIRHPGNLGLLLLAISRPIVLGSFYGLIPGAIGGIIMVVQTFLEDRALQKGISGYQAYTEKVKYRLMEYVW